MIIALDENNNKVSIETIINQEYKDRKFFCPSCGSELIVRNGTVNTPHFAHKNTDDCDDFSKDMSAWHYNWQSLFPEENQEVVIEKEISLNDYLYAADEFNFYRKKRMEKVSKKVDEKGILKIMHRADVCVGEYVIEFQHSPISCKEFNERNWFYTSAGYKVIWIFDVEARIFDGRISAYEITNNNKKKFQWKHPMRCFKNFLPQYEDEIFLFLQFGEPDDGYEKDESGYLNRIFWCIDDENDKGEAYASYRRFMAECQEIGNFIELKEAIANKEI